MSDTPKAPNEYFQKMPESFFPEGSTDLNDEAVPVMENGKQKLLTTKSGKQIPQYERYVSYKKDGETHRFKVLNDTLYNKSGYPTPRSRIRSQDDWQHYARHLEVEDVNTPRKKIERNFTPEGREVSSLPMAYAHKRIEAEKRQISRLSPGLTKVQLQKLAEGVHAPLEDGDNYRSRIDERREDVIRLLERERMHPSKTEADRYIASSRAKTHSYSPRSWDRRDRGHPRDCMPNMFRDPEKMMLLLMAMQSNSPWMMMFAMQKMMERDTPSQRKQERSPDGWSL